MRGNNKTGVSYRGVCPVMLREMETSVVEYLNAVSVADRRGITKQKKKKKKIPGEYAKKLSV